MANHPKTTYIADRAPSSLVDVMELRAKEHSNLFFKTVSSIASSIILQLGQEMAPKDRINERLSDVTGDASNRMFIINCQNDETLFKAKAGSIEVGNQVPFKNKMVTDNTVHADLLKNAERAMIVMFFNENPALKNATVESLSQSMREHNLYGLNDEDFDELMAAADLAYDQK